MKEKFSFTKLAFSNLKWGLVIAIFLLTFWFIEFFEAPKLVLPVVENIVVEKKVAVSLKNYTLADIKDSATFELNADFLKRLFLSRPLLNLDFITCLFIIFLLFSAYRFVKNVENEITFKNKTYKLFYWISISCLIYLIIHHTSNIFINQYILNLTENKYSLKWSVENSFIIAFISYFFFVLGHSFNKGFLLQKEQDLTV